MKKAYMKPQGAVVSMKLNESVAASLDFSPSITTGTLNYIITPDGTYYIQDSTRQRGDNNNDGKFTDADVFYEYLWALINARNCLS